VVEEIIGRLSDLTGAQLGRLEDEIRRERQRRASLAAGGEKTLPVSRMALRRPSRRFWNTALTRTATCSWRYAATYVVTALPASADLIGTSSSTRAVSARSSIWAKPAIQRAPWPPSGQSPWGSRSPDSQDKRVRGALRVEAVEGGRGSSRAAVGVGFRRFLRLMRSVRG
jgi:hypothetical protein